jgi:hypothetical protein
MLTKCKHRVEALLDAQPFPINIDAYVNSHNECAAWLIGVLLT